MRIRHTRVTAGLPPTASIRALDPGYGTCCALIPGEPQRE